MGQSSSATNRGSFISARPGCVVAAGTRICTRGGLPAVETLENNSAEVWTNLGWAVARVAPTEERRPVIRITYVDGAFIECSPTSTIPTVTSGDISGSPEGSLAGGTPPGKSATLSRKPSKPRLRTKWSPKLAAELQSGDRITPTGAPLAEAAPALPGAYALGHALGAKMTAMGEINVAGLGPEIRAWGAASIHDFVDGWSAAQNGSILGCMYVIADLAAILRRTGTKKVLVEKTPLRYSLVLDEREAWPSRDGQNRKWTRRLRTTHQMVADIELTSRCEQQYEIILSGGFPAAISVGNTMIASCPDNAATEITYSCDGYAPPAMPGASSLFVTN